MSASDLNGSTVWPMSMPRTFKVELAEGRASGADSGTYVSHKDLEGGEHWHLWA